MEDYGVDHTTETASCCCDTDGKGTFRAEVLRDDGDTDNEDAARAYPDAESLR